MVEIECWMASLSEKLQAKFGTRLLYLGLQGSYGRGEATQESDIDVVSVLDKVELPDLDAYRAIVGQMPEGEKACGFLCGAEELKRWPKFDLLSVAQDTRGVYGSLSSLLPSFDRTDLAQSVSVGASALYHSVCHTYLYATQENWPEFLQGVHKSAFFILRDLHMLRTGQMVRTKRGLLNSCSGDERELLAYSIFPEKQLLPFEVVFQRLLRWSSAAMTEVAKFT